MQGKLIFLSILADCLSCEGEIKDVWHRVFTSYFEGMLELLFVEKEPGVKKFQLGKQLDSESC